MSDGDLLPRGDNKDKDRPRPRVVTCGGCGCLLGLDGAVIKTGDRARAMATAEDDAASLKRKLETITAERDTLKADNERLRAGAGDDDDDDEDDEDEWG